MSCLINGTDLRYVVDDAEALVLTGAAGERDVHTLAESIAAHLA